MKKITNFILSIFLLYITLSDFFIMQFTSLVNDYKEEAYVIMLMPMIGAIIWWIFLQFNRWRLKLWNKLVTYIGIIVAALGAFPINLIILEIDKNYQNYIPYLAAVMICCKIAMWVFWLWLISNNNMRKYGFNYMAK